MALCKYKYCVLPNSTRLASGNVFDVFSKGNSASSNFFGNNDAAVHQCLEIFYLKYISHIDFLINNK